MIGFLERVISDTGFNAMAVSVVTSKKGNPVARVADPKNNGHRSVTVSIEAFRVLRAASYHGGLKMVCILNEIIANATPELEAKYGFTVADLGHPNPESN